MKFLQREKLAIICFFFTENKRDRPASNIWPPPKAKDYKQSVRDLPANVKLAEVKRDEKVNEVSRHPDSKGDNSRGAVADRMESDMSSKNKHLREMDTCLGEARLTNWLWLPSGKVSPVNVLKF